MKRIPLLIMILYVSLLFAFIQREAEAQDRTLRVGSTPNLGVTPLVALHKGFFQKNGLKVEYKKLQTGKITMDALISGDIDVGTIVDANIGFLNFSANPIKVIAAIATKRDDAIYFNKHKGIIKASDLIGKRIGYVPATTSHVFLARFLEKNGINWSDIKPIILQPPAMEAALRNDAVDAVSIWQPWGNTITQAHKQRLGVFPNEKDLYPSRILLATTERALLSKAVEIKDLIKALKQATDLYNLSPDSTYSYLSQELGSPIDQISSALRQFEFAIVKGSTALPLVKEIGDWISHSQTDFKGKLPFAYSNSFDDRLLIQQADSTQGAGSPLQEVSFCRVKSMLSALLYIAESQNFFTNHGLKIKFETPSNGKICQDMLLAGKADYMSAGEGPFTYLAPFNPPIKILAAIQENPETSIFARRDRGISRFEDLKGKHVAYLPGTVSYFFLARALKRYNLTRSDIKLTAMQPPTMPAALVGGAIDAFAIWEPWGTQATLEMPENVINLADIQIYRSITLLLGRVGAMESNPSVAVSIFKALLAAQNFIETERNKVFPLLLESIGYEQSALEKLWPQFNHNIHLDNDIIKLLEDNFKILQSDDINFKDIPMPNFRSFIDSRFLKQVAPDRVGL